MASAAAADGAYGLAATVLDVLHDPALAADWQAALKSLGPCGRTLKP